MMRTLRKDQVHEQAENVAVVGVERALYDVRSRKRRSAIEVVVRRLIDVYSAFVATLTK